MSRRKQLPERIIILQDVGSNMNQTDNEYGAPLKISKDCIMQILLRKLFGKSVDEFALITFGDKKTDNKLSDGSQYQKINVQTQHFSVVNRDILSLVEQLELNENGTGDWLDAIVVALQFIQDELEYQPCTQYKIVLFSNFNTPVSDDQMDLITKKIQDMGIDFTVIGPDVINKEEDNEESHEDGVALIASMVKKLQGIICSFKEAFFELMYLQRTTTKPTPWNSMFTISSNIKIPIRAFKKIAEAKPYKWIFGTLDDENAAVETEKAYIRHDPENEVDIQVERENLIDAFKFGTTIVPFSDGDKEAMTYKSGSKGLYLVGCTSRDAVPQYLLVGNGSYIIIARQDDDVGSTALESFIQAMFQDNLVGIARRVYTDNSAACAGILYPQVTDDKRYLVYAELPFAEDEHIYKFPSLPEEQVPDEKKRIVNSLVDSMDLDAIDSEGDLYDFTRIYDPHEQYVLRCLGHRYVHPTDTVPNEIMQEMIRVMQPSAEVLDESKDALKNVKEKFPLEVVIKKTKLNKFHNREAILEEVSENKVETNTLFETAPLKLEPAAENSVQSPSSPSSEKEAAGAVKSEDLSDSWLDDL